VTFLSPLQGTYFFILNLEQGFLWKWREAADLGEGHHHHLPIKKLSLT